MPYLGFEPTFGEYPSQIFAGTATRAARSFAEVAISIENNTTENVNKLFNSEELNISRKITKNQGSTYTCLLYTSDAADE